MTRKGASNRASVGPEVLAALNGGTEQTRTLSEMLVMDFAALLDVAAPQIDAAPLRAIADQGVTKRMELAGRLVLPCWRDFLGHPSDTVRGWTAYAIAAEPDLGLAQRLDLLRPLADDSHFGVREWAWLALRPHVVADPLAALRLLSPWTAETSANLRRFASEATRPRGVWCAHVRPLRDDPGPGLAVLEPLCADPHRYVQDSVANWLNDAAKDHPDWVRGVVESWQGRASPYLLKRALRSL
ncbi:MAG: DNA alkylation repair protein [Magnetospirillum gryphiswaldense]|nr:DNA alkylation repair protein [Magnetospirillum gryphiswaldense]